MGRLDDIVARNQKANSSGGGLGLGMIGAMVDATNDPLDTPADKRRKLLAWAIVGGAVAAVIALVALFA